MDRRSFLDKSATLSGAFVLGFWLPLSRGQNPEKMDAAWSSDAIIPEINAWIVIEPDDTVIVRIAQTELGQGVWTSNAMMVCEELQCDWSKVRPEYASVNRDVREMAPNWTLNVPGNGAQDPAGGGAPEFRDRFRLRGIPDSLYRRMRTNEAASVRDGRYYLQMAGAEARERLLLAAANQWQVPVIELTARDSTITHGPSGRTVNYGEIAELAMQTPHPDPESITIKAPDQWTLMGTEQKNLDIPDKVSARTVYGIDVRLPGMKWATVKSCPVYGGDVKSYDFDVVRDMPGVQSVFQFPIPDPALTRGRVFSGGVAIIADRFFQAKTAMDRMHIEWEVPEKYATFNTENMHQALLDSLDTTGTVRVDEGDVDSVFNGTENINIIEATYSTPYLPRARMEPGNATVLVTDDRVDIWIGDQSPQETRFSASEITGVPEENVYLHQCHLGGGYGRNGNGPQAEQAIMIANTNRGTPIHMLWTREEDFIGTTYRAMGVARLKAALDTNGWPMALEVKTGMQDDGFGSTSSFDVASRYYSPNYRFSNHMTDFHVPVGTRRGIGQAAHEFYRESFINEIAHTAGRDPYEYRRELISRTDLPYKNDMIRALDMAAEMSNWGTPLPEGTARAIALEERGGESNGVATISAMVHTVSISKSGVVRLKRVDVAHETGYGLINPLSVRKQIEGQIAWFYNDAMHQACHVDGGRIKESNFDTFPISRINEDPLEINIQFFNTQHWLAGMGHDRATSVQSAIGEAIFQITGRRYRDLPFRQFDLRWS